MRETTYKLSFLKDELLLINEEGVKVTVKQLNEGLSNDIGIQEGNIDLTPNELKRSKWYIARKDTWSVDAHSMIKSYLENSHASESVPGWYETAREAMNEIDFQSIEKLVMDVFSKTKGITEFHEKGERVLIEQ